MFIDKIQIYVKAGDGGIARQVILGDFHFQQNRILGAAGGGVAEEISQGVGHQRALFFIKKCFCRSRIVWYIFIPKVIKT